MAKLEILEESVLRWPDGCDRTRIKERKSKAAWKFPWAKYREMLADEMRRMGPNSAASKIIDLLMLHRELTHDQIRIQIGTNRMQTVYDAVSKLNKASLLVKNGDKFSLKEL